MVFQQGSAVLVFDYIVYYIPIISLIIVNIFSNIWYLIETCAIIEVSG